MKKYLFCSLLLVLFGQFVFPQSPDSLQEFSDLSYYQGEGDAHELQKLNLVLARDTKNSPLLVWIGGGAWSYVDRNVEMDLARKFAEEGISVASIGHRLSSAVWRDSSMNTGIQHPEHVQDLAMAMKWLYDHASDYGFSADKIIVGGFSSGAHLASLLYLDTRYLQAWGLSPEHIKGLIPISGTYDIADYYRAFYESENRKHLAEQHVQAVFGESEAHFKDASPIQYLENLSCPMLVMSDNGTGIVNYTRLFEERIKERNFKQAEFVYVAEFGHGDLWRNIGQQEESKYRQKMIDFIKGITNSQG